MSTPEDVDALIREVEAQQRRLVLDTFDEDDAWALGCLVVELARERSLPVAVAILRNGHRLFHASLPGTVPDNDTWLERKARVVDRFGAPSFLVGLRARRRGTSFAEHSGLDVQQYAAHGGSVPLTVRGVGPVGTLTVSGLPQEQDHALVVEALELFLARRRPVPEAAHRAGPGSPA